MNNYNFKKGQMLIIGILFLAILLIFSTTIFTKVRYFINFGANSTFREQARHVAEAGIDKAIRSIVLDSSYTGESGLTVGTAGTVNIIVQNKSPQLKTIIAEGFVPNATNTKAKQKIQVDAGPEYTEIVNIMLRVKHHASVVNFEPATGESYVYALGGTDRGVGCRQDKIVQYAPIINPSNPLGPWQTTEALPLEVILHSAAAVNGYIYVIGGEYLPDCISKDTVYFAKPLNGQIPIGGWSTTANLQYPLTWHTSFSANNRIYVIGGLERDLLTNIESSSSKIYFAEPNPADGTIDTWNQNSQDLPEPRHSMGTAFSSVNQHVYIVGGGDCIFDGCEKNTVYYAPVNAGTGTVGPFTESPSPNKLPIQLWNTDSVVVGDYLYVLGGVRQASYGSSSVTVPDVYFAHINSNGSIDAFSKSLNSLPRPYDGGTAVVIGNKIYYLGGHEGSSPTGNVWSTDVDLATGEIGPWTNNGAPITYEDWALNKQTYIAK